MFDRWTKEKGVLNLTEQEGLPKFIDFDTLLNEKIYAALKELEQSNVDTLGIFVASSSGAFFTRDSCQAGYYPNHVCLFWRSQGIGFLQKITGKCQSVPKANDSVQQIFDFYQNNLNQIDSEYIMPVISSGKIDSTDKFDYEGTIVFDMPQYCVFCKLDKHVKFLSFARDYYTYKESLFLEYNLQSKSYELFTKMYMLLHP